MRDLNDRQAELHDAIKAAEELLAALQSAESCETEEDFEANLGDALGFLKEIKSEIKELVTT